MSSVFISYSRSDAVFADKLAIELERLYGKDQVWIDRNSIPFAEAWWGQIQRGIEAKDNFLLIMSPRSIGSPVCHLEIEHARHLNKRIVPIMHHPIDEDACKDEVVERLKDNDYVVQLVGDRSIFMLFEANLKVLSGLNWFPFPYDSALDQPIPDDHPDAATLRAARDLQEVQFHAQFAPLHKTLETDQPHVQQHTRLSTRAREWDENQRVTSLLLQSDDMARSQAWLVAWDVDATARKAKGESPRAPEPTALVRAYIAASGEHDRQQRRQRQRLRWSAVGSTVIAAIMLILALAAGAATARYQQDVFVLGTTLTVAPVTVVAGETAIAVAQLALSEIRATAAAVESDSLVTWAINWYNLGRYEMAYNLIQTYFQTVDPPYSTTALAYGARIASLYGRGDEAIQLLSDYAVLPSSVNDRLYPSFWALCDLAAHYVRNDSLNKAARSLIRAREAFDDMDADVRDDFEDGENRLLMVQASIDYADGNYRAVIAGLSETADVLLAGGTDQYPPFFEEMLFYLAASYEQIEPPDMASACPLWMAYAFVNVNESSAGWQTRQAEAQQYHNACVL